MLYRRRPSTHLKTDKRLPAYRSTRTAIPALVSQIRFPAVIPADGAAELDDAGPRQAVRLFPLARMVRRAPEILVPRVTLLVPRQPNFAPAVPARA